MHFHLWTELGYLSQGQTRIAELQQTHIYLNKPIGDQHNHAAEQSRDH